MLAYVCVESKIVKAKADFMFGRIRIPNSSKLEVVKDAGQEVRSLAAKSLERGCRGDT